MKTCCKGSVLAALPLLGDPNFIRTVVLIAEHSEEGGFGLVVNRPASIKVSKIWEVVTGGQCECDSTVYVGGPVQASVISYLHTCRDMTDDASEVAPGVYFGTDVEVLGSLIERQRVSTEEGENRELFRVFCGYSGWGEGQLDRELGSGSWFVQQTNAAFLFESPIGEMWNRIMGEADGESRFFAMRPKDPDYN